MLYPFRFYLILSVSLFLEDQIIRIINGIDIYLRARCQDRWGHRLNELGGFVGVISAGGVLTASGTA